MNQIHDSRSKIPIKKSRPYIYIKFLALLGAPYIYDVSRLRVNCFLSIFVSVEVSDAYVTKKIKDKAKTLCN
jgi:hypothetical protein